MTRQKATRESNLRSSIYQGEDGYWHGRVTMGVRDNGTPDRRHVMSKDKATVTAKVRRLERQRDDGVVIRPGPAWTVEKWLIHWLENVARPSVRYNAGDFGNSSVSIAEIPQLVERSASRFRG